MSSVTIVLFLLCLLICHVKLQCSAKATVEQIGSSFSRSSTTAGNNGFSRFQSTKNSFTNTPNESTDINDPSKLEIKNANEFLDRHSRIGFIRKVCLVCMFY